MLWIVFCTPPLTDLFQWRHPIHVLKALCGPRLLEHEATKRISELSYRIRKSLIKVNHSQLNCCQMYINYCLGWDNVIGWFWIQPHPWFLKDVHSYAVRFLYGLYFHFFLPKPSLIFHVLCIDCNFHIKGGVRSKVWHDLSWVLFFIAQ